MIDLTTVAFSLLGVLAGGFATYKAQLMLQAHRNAEIDSVTCARVTALLRTAESRFELSARFGARPIERNVPFERVFDVVYGSEVAALVVNRGSASFYPISAELEQAYRAMWYSVDQIIDASDKLNAAGVSIPDRSSLERRIAESRLELKAAASRAQVLCVELRSMLGDHSKSQFVEVGDQQP